MNERSQQPTLTTDAKPARKATASPRLTLSSGAEIQLDRDGDLEIDISESTGAQRWEGVFLNNEDAKLLRDYLNKVLP